MRRTVFLRWQANNQFAWGIVGQGLLQSWASDPDLQPVFAYKIGPLDLRCVDPLRWLAMDSAIALSNRFVEQLASADESALREAVVVEPVDNGLVSPAARVTGHCHVGRCIFEDTRLDGARERLKGYDSLVCASEWAAALLRAASGRDVAVLHEGIDAAKFFPGPRSGVLHSGRFYVFSGGKVEYRKAHDLVIMAFREFAARHDDAVLVAAWHCPWPQISVGFQGRLDVPLQCRADGALGIRQWVEDNGVQPHQFIELPPMPNSLMPDVLREMDCAVQVSRCEACTNLPAKEAMACGVPVILANNTGVKDLIEDGNCIPIDTQRPVTHPQIGTEGWGECEVEEIVTALERLYADTELRRRLGASSAASILERGRTWTTHAARLKAHLLQLV